MDIGDVTFDGLAPIYRDRLHGLVIAVQPGVWYGVGWGDNRSRTMIPTPERVSLKSELMKKIEAAVEAVLDEHLPKKTPEPEVKRRKV
jgi:hypothetical protein